MVLLKNSLLSSEKSHQNKFRNTVFTRAILHKLFLLALWVKIAMVTKLLLSLLYIFGSSVVN